MNNIPENKPMMHVWTTPMAMDQLKSFPIYTPNARGELLLPAGVTEAELDLIQRQIDDAMRVMRAVSIKPADPPGGGLFGALGARFEQLIDEQGGF